MSRLDDAVTAALSSAWRKIQALEPGVPDAVWYLTSGRSSSCATGPWSEAGPLVLRVNLRVRNANRRGRDMVGQLLHWAAHAAIGVSTGAEGRYHSREFGQVAEALGLSVKQEQGLGWAPEMTKTGSLTAGGSIYKTEVLTRDARTHFGPEIAALSKAMAAWKPEAEETPRKEGRGPVSMACRCDPPRLIRASTGVALGPRIRCEQCRRSFRIKPGQRISELDRTQSTALQLPLE